jgi:hypothetical protein
MLAFASEMHLPDVQERVDCLVQKLALKKNYLNKQ